jgi:hypothetical protein
MGTAYVVLGLHILTIAFPPVMDIRGTWSSNPLNASLETVLPLVGP